MCRQMMTAVRAKATQVSAVLPEPEPNPIHGVWLKRDDVSGEAGLEAPPGVSAPVSVPPGRNDWFEGLFNPSDRGAGSIAET